MSTSPLKPNVSTVTSQLMNSQRRAHEIDARERDRIEGMRRRSSVGSALKSSSAASGGDAGGRGAGSSSSPGGGALSGPSGGGGDSKRENSRYFPFCYHEAKQERDVHLEVFPSNEIITSRYSLQPWRLNFILWKNLYEQFHRRANWFFFFVGILELVPQLESLSQITLITLTVVLLLGMMRSLFEDLQRQAADRLMNSQEVMCIKAFEDTEWRTVPSNDVRVGDLVLLEASARNVTESIPCDIVLLATSELDGTCAVQSAQIDGEAKWTMKRALPVTNVPTSVRFMDGDELGEAFVRSVTQMFEGATITCDKPDGSINEFAGSIRMRSSLEEFQLQIPQLLLRGTQLRKAKWVVGACVYTGNQTKALMGHEMPTRKWSRVEMVVNTLILISLVFYLAIVIGSTVAWSVVSDVQRWYMPRTASDQGAGGVVKMLFSFIIFFSNAIPISLYVTLEIIELVASFLIESDLCIYDHVQDRCTTVRAPELLPDLGQVNYLFCDKTGTVTRNELSLRKFSVRGEVYGSGTTEIGRAVLKFKGEEIPEDEWMRRERERIAAEDEKRRREKEEEKEKMLQLIKPREQGGAAGRRSSGASNARGSGGVTPATSAGGVTPQKGDVILSAPVTPGGGASTDDNSPALSPLLERQRGLPEITIRDDSQCPFYDPRFDEETWFTHMDGPQLERLFTVMAVCHTANIGLKYQKARRRTKSAAKLQHVKKYDGESPDECALCEAARKFGVEFAERKGDTVFIENRNGLRKPYVVHDVLPFTSERMRMSCIVELADHTFKLFSKGADSVMFPLALQNADTSREAGAAAQLAAEGLRTLVFAERTLEEGFVREWLRRDTQVKNVGDFYFDSSHNLRSKLAREMEQQLTIIGCTGMEDMLQYGVPDCFQAMRAANIKVWLVTGDSREAAINIGYSCGLSPVEAHLIELYGITKHNLGDLEWAIENPLAPGSSASGLGGASSPGSSPIGSPFGSLSGPSAMQMQTASARTRRTSSPLMGIAAQQQGGAAAAGAGAASSSSGAGAGKLLDLNDMGLDVPMIDSPVESPFASSAFEPKAARSSQQQQQQQQQPAGNNNDSKNENSAANNNAGDDKARLYVAILDGITFNAILDDATEEQQKKAFLALSRCASVLCARFSSSQKARVINFVQSWTKKLDGNEQLVSVAIGDGTNDIPMLRAANVGIGMFGVESFDAANAGDFAIAQFWFLQRLILNHGRNSYRRFAFVIKFFLYKNLVYVLMLFFFAMQSHWTPQAFIPSNLLGLYNILFTSLPIIIAGIMDRDVFLTDWATRRLQELYWPGQKCSYLDLRGLLPWIANAVMHSIVVYFFTQMVLDDALSPEGVTMGADATALTTYTTIIVMVNVQLGFHITSFTSLTLLGFWLSVIGWFFFMMLYSALPPESSQTTYRAFNNVGFQAAPWMAAFIAVQLCSAREAFSNFLVFNIYQFSKMSLKRIIQLADSANSRFASTREPYEIAVLELTRRVQKSGTTSSQQARSALLSTSGSGGGGAAAGSTLDDTDISDQLNFFLQFKDGELEEQFIENYLGKLTRYKVGCAVALVFSTGIVLIQLLGVVRGTGTSSALEAIGWALFSLVAGALLFWLMTQEPERVRHTIHQLMLVALLIAFSGMSIANFRASQRNPDAHPVSMAVAVFGLLVMVRPPLVHIMQYLVLGITTLAMWYQIFRVESWQMKDIVLRALEFIIVFVISLIGLVVGEKFDRKLFIMKAAIQKSLQAATEAETRSHSLLKNILPEGIVAEISDKRVKRYLSDFSVTLNDTSVLQSDIVSFTLFSSTKQPHAVVEMLNSMFKKFDAHVNELGIEKIKTVGDAYVCAAGVPSADRQHAEKIVAFGLRMVRSIHELNREGVPSIPDLNIQIRVGAATGPVRAGVVAMEKMRYELMGAVAEECEKMEQTGMPDRVQVSPALYALTESMFTYQRVTSGNPNAEPGKEQFFVVDNGNEPYFSDQKTASVFVTINKRGTKDRFKILQDENRRRRELLHSQDPAIGGKLNRWNLSMANDDLEAEFRKHYLVLADARTNVETAQSTIMYALVASIVGTFVGSANNPVVILQIVIAVSLGLITIVRIGIPLLRDCKNKIARMWSRFERQVSLGARGGAEDDLDDDSDPGRESSVGSGSRRSSIESTYSVTEMQPTAGGGAAAGGGGGSSSGPSGGGGGGGGGGGLAALVASGNGRHRQHDTLHSYNASVEERQKQALPQEAGPLQRFGQFLAAPSTTVYTVGLFTLADPIIVLFAVDAEGISRGAVFVTLAAASFIFSQMHLLFLQKIALASVHLLVVSAAFFVRTAVYNSFDGSRDGGDFVGILCCYVLCVGAAYTTERSVRKAFVASKAIERRNADISSTLHLCEKLLHNSIPASIVRRLQEAPDRAVVDEIPDASVLFLYVDGVIPHEHHGGDEPAAAGGGAAASANLGSSSNLASSVILRGGGSDTDITPDVVTRMNDVFYVLDALCRHHLVEKIKTLPYLVVSGCPEPLPKHCHRLACVAKDALAFAESYNRRLPPGEPPLRIRAGLHTGRVTAGVLGTSKFVYDVFGDTVNLSSRLASNAVWGTAACSEAARVALMQDNVSTRERGKVYLKGKGDWNVFEICCDTLRIPTPAFVDDIDTYLETAPAAVRKSARDPHNHSSVFGESQAGGNVSDRGSGVALLPYGSSRRSSITAAGGGAAAAAAAALRGNNPKTSSDEGNSNANALSAFTFPTDEPSADAAAPAPNEVDSLLDAPLVPLQPAPVIQATLMRTVSLLPEEELQQRREREQQQQRLQQQDDDDLLFGPSSSSSPPGGAAAAIASPGTTVVNVPSSPPNTNSNNSNSMNNNVINSRPGGYNDTVSSVDSDLGGLPRPSASASAAPPTVLNLERHNEQLQAEQQQQREQQQRSGGGAGASSSDNKPQPTLPKEPPRNASNNALGEINSDFVGSDRSSSGDTVVAATSIISMRRDGSFNRNGRGHGQGSRSNRNDNNSPAGSPAMNHRHFDRPAADLSMSGSTFAMESPRNNNNNNNSNNNSNNDSQQQQASNPLGGDGARSGAAASTRDPLANDDDILLFGPSPTTAAQRQPPAATRPQGRPQRPRHDTDSDNDLLFGPAGVRPQPKPQPKRRTGHGTDSDDDLLLGPVRRPAPSAVSDEDLLFGPVRRPAPPAVSDDELLFGAASSAAASRPPQPLSDPTSRRPAPKSRPTLNDDDFI